MDLLTHAGVNWSSWLTEHYQWKDSLLIKQGLTLGGGALVGEAQT